MYLKNRCNCPAPPQNNMCHTQTPCYSYPRWLQDRTCHCPLWAPGIQSTVLSAVRQSLDVPPIPQPRQFAPHLPVQTVPFPWNPAAHLHEPVPSGLRRQLRGGRTNGVNRKAVNPSPWDSQHFFIFNILLSPATQGACVRLGSPAHG